jgi:beta-glucosidase
LNRKSKRIGARQALICTLSALMTVVASGQTPSAMLPDDKAVEKRVNALLDRMTLEEKIGQLSQLFLFGPSKQVDDALAKGQLGSLLFVTDPARINSLQRIAVEKSRLHIPLIFGFDVIHGFRTIFPVPIAMAASWDPPMVSAAQAIAAKEASSVGINWTFAPMVDIARDRRGPVARLRHGRRPGARVSGRIYRLAGPRPRVHETLCRLRSGRGRPGL